METTALQTPRIITKSFHSDLCPFTKRYSCKTLIEYVTETGETKRVLFQSELIEELDGIITNTYELVYSNILQADSLKTINYINTPFYFLDGKDYIIEIQIVHEKVINGFKKTLGL